MFRFVDRLAVEFKDERRVTSFQKLIVDVLMTGNTSVGAHVKISEIAHIGIDTDRVGPIGAGVSTQPRPGRAVTTFAGNAFIRMGGWSESGLRDGLKWRMANRAARAWKSWRDQVMYWLRFSPAPP